MKNAHRLSPHTIGPQAKKISRDELTEPPPNDIPAICEHMAAQGINSLSLEYEGGSLLYFENQNEVIHYGEAHEEINSTEHMSLLTQVHDSTIGHHTTPQARTSAERPVKDDLEDAIISETILIHDSLFQSLDAFEASFRKAEIMYEPLKASGGDIYFVRDFGDKTLVIVGDCTGHGLPGAMIAMSIMTLLKHHFKHCPEQLTREIYQFYELIDQTLEGGAQTDFDVEMGFILLNKKNNTLKYSGSGINLIIKTPDTTSILTSRKRFVIQKALIEHEVNLQEGDVLFLFTDGVTDQFDHAGRRRLGLTGIDSMIRSMKVDDTMDSFQTSFNTFRGSRAPLDDQTLLMLTI